MTRTITLANHLTDGELKARYQTALTQLSHGAGISYG